VLIKSTILLLYFFSIGTLVKAQLLPVSRLNISQKEIVVKNNSANEVHETIKLRKLEKGTTPERGFAEIRFDKVSKKTWLILSCKGIGAYKLRIVRHGGRINNHFLWVKCIGSNGKRSTWDFYYNKDNELARLSFGSEKGLMLLF
jgi:hypothetical protein